MAMLGQGLVLMIAGMTIVYLFLWVLIVVSKKASALVSRFDYLIPDEAPKRAVCRGPSGQVARVRPTLSTSASLAKGEKVRAPVPGTVLRVTVTSGSRVAKGEELLVMDVMKMETPFSAPCDGVVTILVSATDKVATGDALAVIER